jgi:EAL domain-containing protein (putative c-di-GMP-specific phosphodiesterase class I)
VIDDVVPDMPDLDALLEMPFTSVKFDKSLGRGGLDCRSAARFIDRVIAVAQRRRMTVIAEGIEDSESWVSLRDCGVTYGQGYWVSRPLPYAELPGWIAGWNQRRAQLP